MTVHSHVGRICFVVNMFTHRGLSLIDVSRSAQSPLIWSGAGSATLKAETRYRATAYYEGLTSSSSHGPNICILAETQDVLALLPYQCSHSHICGPILFVAIQISDSPQ